MQRPPVINAVLRTRRPRRQPRPPPALRFEPGSNWFEFKGAADAIIGALQQTFPDFKPASGSGFRPRPQTPIPLLPLTARVDGEDNRVEKESKPDLALDLGSSYRYENRKGANVYGCFGFAMPKKKRYSRTKDQG